MPLSELERTKLYGVIEGFYGKPWTAGQRRELFKRMRRMGLSTYLYAPKDDCKHRLHWRQKYVDAEADDLKDLIRAATEENVIFVYALSPGLDMTFSNPDEVTLLKEKLDQVKGFGCSSFALLYDDIEPELCSQDSDVFTSQAEAQCVVTNDVYKHIGPTDVFLFCPTEYCTSRADPDLARSEYLKTLGKELHPDIDILWTGPKVVSRLLTIESIQEVKEVLRRPPLIWDNLHANDYDQTRLYLGPYEGRPQELTNHLRGVLTNPNCEVEANFIAMHTLAQWSENTVRRYPPIPAQSDKANAMDTSPQRDKTDESRKCGYHPRKALVCAIEDWLPELYKPRDEVCKNPGKGYIRAWAEAAKRLCGRDQSHLTHFVGEIVGGPLKDSDDSSDINQACRQIKKAAENIPAPISGSYLVNKVKTEEDGARLKVDLKNKLTQSDHESDMEAMSVDINKDNEGDIESRQSNVKCLSETKAKESESESKQRDSEASKSPSEKVSNSASTSATQGSAEALAPMETVDKACPCDSPMDTKGLEADEMLSAAELLNSIKKKKEDKKIDDLPALNCGDMLLLCDLFSVPFSYGPKAVHLLKTGHWLVKNVGRVKDIDSTKAPFSEQPPEVREWYETAVSFHDSYRDVVLMVDKLVAVPNRELLYELYTYVNDMRGVLSLLNAYIKWNGMGKPDKEPFRGGEQEPWVHRSGIYSEFRRLLPFNGQHDMFGSVERQPQPCAVFTVRPYFPADKDDVYSVCLATCDDGADGSNLFPDHTALEADQSIGGLLSLCPQYCYVLEDDSGIAGYALAAPGYDSYAGELVRQWLPQMRQKYAPTDQKEKDDLSATEEVIRTIHSDPVKLPQNIMSDYPSLIQMRVKSNLVQFTTASKALLGCVVKAMKQQGSRGVHTVIHSSHFNLLSFYIRLGFADVTPEKAMEDDCLILGKSI